MLANQDLASLKSQFELITALQPKVETKPLEGLKGKVTADEKSGYLAELTGYAALDRVAKQVADAVEAEVDENARIIIVDSPDFASGGVPLLDLQMRLAWFKDRLIKQGKENRDLLLTLDPKGGDEGEVRELAALPALPALIALAAIPGVLSAVPDVLGFFKTDTTLAGQDFAIPQSALQMAVASGLVGSDKRLSVYLPASTR